MVYSNRTRSIYSVQGKQPYIYAFAGLLSLLFCFNAIAAPPSRPNTYVSGTTILSSSVNDDFNTLYNYLSAGVDTIRDGTIVNSDVAGGANIASSKLNLSGITQNVTITGTLTVGGTAYAQVPTGVIMAWTTNTAPTGWLLCDGSAVSRTTYSTLFTLISTTYGSGDGSTTFNVPDLKGRVILGQDDMGGVSANRVTDTDADTLGGADGEETHTLVTAEIPAHQHTVTTMEGYAAGTNYISERNAGSTADTKDTTSVGGDGAHNNLQPFLTLNYIIKY
jgi:microcystin-dependent protein